MRVKAWTAAGLGALFLLAACGKPSQPGPATPSEPAAAPESSAEPTAAQKKAALADLPAAYQSADLDNGQAKFALCKSCHTASAGGPDMTGPNLHGVFGRKAGTKAGFNYSDAMKAYGVTWSAEALDKYLVSPRTAVPGTKMTFVGLPDAKNRTDLIAYLKVATSVPAS